MNATKKINYQETESFKKDFKKLQKRFRTLADDLEIVKKYAIEIFHLENIDNLSIVMIPGFNTEKINFYKIRKVSCKALKNRGANTGLRVTYAYHPESATITFIEIYFKGDQQNEDKERLKIFLQQKV